ISLCGFSSSSCLAASVRPHLGLSWSATVTIRRIPVIGERHALVRLREVLGVVMSASDDFPRPDESCRLADGRLAEAAIARWYDVRLRATHGILIALDMESLDRMRKVVEQTSGIPGVVGYKVGLTLTLRLGLGGAVRHLRASTDLPLIYDHQKAGPDVP